MALENILNFLESAVLKKSKAEDHHPRLSRVHVSDNILICLNNI